MDINYFRAIQNALGAETEVEANIREAKRDITDGMMGSVGLVHDGKRNGQPQRFVLAREISLFKYNIVAFPDEELNIGDVLDLRGEKWIVKDVKLSNPIQRVGIIYLANLTLRFQNHSSDIIERPAVLDKGQYSTTVGEEKDIRYPNDKIKIYLPYDEDTKYIYIDKRVATGIVYDKYGNEMLETFKITKVNHTTVNFGKNAHLLELTVESDQYSPSNDNLSEMICDYIAPSIAPQPSDKLKCTIQGRRSIFLGSTRTYKPLFYDNNGTAITGIVPIWEYDQMDGISLESAQEQCKLKVANDEQLIGSIINLTLKDDAGLYEPCTMNITVEV